MVGAFTPALPPVQLAPTGSAAIAASLVLTFLLGGSSRPGLRGLLIEPRAPWG